MHRLACLKTGPSHALTYKRLQQATQENKPEKLQNILNRGEISPEDLNQSFLLHKAAAFGHIQCMQILLNYGADPNFTTRHGCSAIHLLSAAGSDNSDAVRAVVVLVKGGADINYKGNAENGGTPALSCKFTALGHAADLARMDVVQALITNGAKVDEIFIELPRPVWWIPDSQKKFNLLRNFDQSTYSEMVKVLVNPEITEVLLKSGANCGKQIQFCLCFPWNWPSENSENGKRAQIDKSARVKPKVYQECNSCGAEPLPWFWTKRFQMYYASYRWVLAYDLQRRTAKAVQFFAEACIAYPYQMLPSAENTNSPHRNKWVKNCNDCFQALLCRPYEKSCWMHNIFLYYVVRCGLHPNEALTNIRKIETIFTPDETPFYRHLDGRKNLLQQWISNYMQQLPTLVHLSVRVVRSYLNNGKNIIYGAEQLQLPKRIKQLILLRDDMCFYVEDDVYIGVNNEPAMVDL